MTKYEKLEEQIKQIVSQDDITIEEIGKLGKSKRKTVLDDRLLKINLAAVNWALQNKLIAKDALKIEKFYTSNKGLQDAIATTGILGVAGGTGAFFAYTATLGTAGSGIAGALGTGSIATFASTIGLGTVATAGATIGGALLFAAAPLAIACVGIYIYGTKKNEKEILDLKKTFEMKQDEILDYYRHILDKKRIEDEIV